MNKKYNKQAFTLVELLVVATVICVLTVIAVVNYEKAKAKSRDSERKSDLTKISLALTSYYADNKNYINTQSFINISTNTVLVDQKYLSVMPSDPTSDTDHYYQYKSDGVQYKLRALSETIKASDNSDIAKNKAGDYYDSANQVYFQISSSSTALDWN